MPLFDVTKKPDRLITPKEGEEYEFIQKAKKTLDPRSYEKMIKLTDNAILNLKPSAKSELVWTKCGALFGFGSKEPHADINYIWDRAIEVVGDNEFALKLVGGLLRWRISLLEDTWLMFREDTDKINPLSGKEIKISTYWINNDYVHPDLTPSATINMLSKKFNRK